MNSNEEKPISCISSISCMFCSLRCCEASFTPYSSYQWDGGRPGGNYRNRTSPNFALKDRRLCAEMHQSGLSWGLGHPHKVAAEHSPATTGR